MKILTRISNLFRRDKLEAEMAEEIRHHVELQTELNIKAGIEPDEARYAALRQFGNVASIQEQARERRPGVWAEQLLQDIRYAFRQLARAPGFTTVTVGILALGIGATTAIYSMVDAVILNPVGGPQPERMVQISQREVFMGKDFFQGVSFPVLESLLAGRNEFSDLAWSDSCQLERTTGEFITIEFGACVSSNYFVALGAQPLLGRTFLPEEALSIVDGLPTADGSIMLSYSWWQSAWGGDPQIIGRSIEMSGRHFTVIGVMPSHFRFPRHDVPFWIPAKPIMPLGQGVRMAVTQVVGRLKADTTQASVQAMLDTLAHRLMRDHPAASPNGGMWRQTNPKGLEIVVRPLAAVLQNGADWSQFRQTLLGLFAAIGFVLLIVCANVANLTLARVERRRHELAIRAATGASQGRLMRQLLTENLLLALLGGACGLLVAAWGLKVLVALNVMPRLRPVEIDLPLFAVAFLLSVVTGLFFGLTSILHGGRVRVSPLLADGGMNATGGRTRSRYRDLLVVLQVALAIVLLTGAGLMLRSVNRLLRVDPGFDPQNLLFVDLTLPWRKYDDFNLKNGPELKLALFTRLTERLKGLPAVKAVAFHQDEFISKFTVEGRHEPIYVLHDEATTGAADFFQAMRAPLLAGRYFAPEDGARKTPVIVNETLAQTAWPGQTAVGKKLILEGSADEAWDVVGVIGDTREEGPLKEVRPTIYHPYEAFWTKSRIIGGAPPHIMIRTERDPSGLISLVRHELKEAEPALLLPRFRTASDRLFDSTVAQRTYRNYLGLFAGLSLLLSALGVYGVLSYSVTRRTREIGIRLAIGAEQRQVHTMIMQQGSRLIGVGLLVGLGASIFLTRLLQSQLYQVSPNDPLVISGAVTLLAAVALTACWLPARRAAKVDPVIALRAE